MNHIQKIINSINEELSYSTKNFLYEKHRMSEIIDITGMKKDSTEISLILKDKKGDLSKIKFFHEQDCCENVQVDQVDGDVTRHIGAAIYAIREKVSCDEETTEYMDDSITWTFYDIETSKGRLSFRWHGSSNGYYSEGVDIQQ